MQSWLKVLIGRSKSREEYDETIEKLADTLRESQESADLMQRTCINIKANTELLRRKVREA